MSIGRKGERQTRNRLLTIENKVMVTRGQVCEGWVKQVMEIKEYTYHDEHWAIKIKT